MQIEALQTSDGFRKYLETGQAISAEKVHRTENSSDDSTNLMLLCRQIAEITLNPLGNHLATTVLVSLNERQSL